VYPDVKIVATIGPASRDRAMLQQMLEAGMHVVRLNFSHGEHAEHAAVIAHVRALEQELGCVCAILADLCGPKLRLGELAPGTHTLVEGADFTLVGSPVAGDATRASVSVPAVLDEIRVGEEVLIDDGLLRLLVTEVKRSKVHCKVVYGGELHPRKGINLPQTKLTLPCLTDKDLADLDFILTQDVDYIAMSFVRTPADVMDLKRRIRQAGRDLPVIAKLEKPQAIERLEDILEVAGGVMVARGDLGVEMNPEDVPHIQKRIIKAANAFNKPVITATQMLESMVTNPRPTRAEASDVANAILDGTDAVMLSAESASGRYPVRAIEMMTKIIRSSRERRAERPWVDRKTHAHAQGATFTRAISHAAFAAARDIDAKAIVCVTLTGTTALVMSKHQPDAPIVAFSHKDPIRRRMALYRGVLPCPMRVVNHTDELIYEVERYLIEHGIAKIDDGIVILSGAPLDRMGPTNLLKLHKIEG